MKDDLSSCKYAKFIWLARQAKLSLNLEQLGPSLIVYKIDAKIAHKKSTDKITAWYALLFSILYNEWRQDYNLITIRMISMYH